MADIVDRANDAVADFLENALSRQRNSARCDTVINHDDVRLCQDCDSVIAQQRITAQPNCTRCVSCQTLFEQQKGRRND